MDELDKLAARAEQHEAKAAAAAEFEPVQEQGVVQGVAPSEAAANAAESVLRVAEGVVKLIADSRLGFGDAEIEQGRDSLGSVFEKYGVAGSGDGRIPYWQEIGAGLYLGGLFKRIKQALAQLRAEDKAKEQANQQANQQAGNQANVSGNQAEYGKEREHQPEERPHTVSSQVGVGEVADTEAPKWLG